MQLLMRRPEISGFISVAPLAKHYDFSFLAPCPASGLFVNGDKDTVTPPEAVNSLVSKLKTQRGIIIEHKIIAGANHFFEEKIEELTKICANYLDKRLAREA
jgi:alpha/beta superfamily hydrolase